jgi:hypothetical protein
MRVLNHHLPKCSEEDDKNLSKDSVFFRSDMNWLHPEYQTTRSIQYPIQFNLPTVHATVTNGSVCHL